MIPSHIDQSTIQETNKIAQEIITNLSKQTETLENNCQKSRQLADNSKKTYKEVKKISAFYYRWWYWLISFIPDITYGEETPESSDKINNTVENDNCSINDDLTQLQLLSKNINNELDTQNKILDKTDDYLDKVENNQNQSSKLVTKIL